MNYNCGYCQGTRGLCNCTEDCGAREADQGHVCPKAPPEVVATWLRSTGMYSEEEIARSTGDKKKTMNDIPQDDELVRRVYEKAMRSDSDVVIWPTDSRRD